MEEAVYHVPVLLKECVDGLVVNPAGVYADVTFGGGGHSRAIVSRLDTAGHLYSFDQDEDAEANIVADGRFYVCPEQFPVPEELDALLRRGRVGRPAG